jgi:fucose permease
MFTLSYGVAVIVPVVAGAVWDLTQIPASAFLPMVLCCIVLIALAPAIGHLRRRTG